MESRLQPIYAQLNSPKGSAPTAARPGSVEIIVVLDRKAFKTPVIDISFTGGVIVSVVAHRMRGSHPPQKFAHPSSLGRPQHQLPVIGRQLISEQLNGIPLQSLGQYPLNGFVVGFLVKEIGPRIATV